MVNFKLNAKNFRDAESMATAYLTAYFGNSEIEYPISPFKMLKDDILTSRMTSTLFKLGSK